MEVIHSLGVGTHVDEKEVTLAVVKGKCPSSSTFGDSRPARPPDEAYDKAPDPHAQDSFQLSALAHVEKCGKLRRTAGTCEGRLEQMDRIKIVKGKWLEPTMDESTGRQDWPCLGRRLVERGETRGCQNVVDDLNGFLDQRVELNQEIQGKVAERQELFSESGEYDAAHGLSTFSQEEVWFLKHSRCECCL